MGPSMGKQKAQKFEARNPKQTQSHNTLKPGEIQNNEREPRFEHVRLFWFVEMFRISDFEFRICKRLRFP
jgi:hypothetical protein